MNKRWHVGIVGLVWLVFSGMVAAQGGNFTFDRDAGTQEYLGIIEDEARDDVVVVLHDLQAGDTIYAVAYGKDNLDPFLVLTDNTGQRSLAEDDNSGGERNASLAFAVPQAGNYVLGMYSVNGTGGYRLVVGVNDSGVLDDRPLDVIGAQIGSRVTYGDSFVGQRNNMSEFAGAFEDAGDEVLVVLPNLETGDVIYIYAAGLGYVDTFITVMDAAFEDIFAEDDDSGGGYNSALSFEVETAGTYTVGLTTLNQMGNYELVVGVNTPQVLERVNQPTGVSSAESAVTFDCSSIDFGDRPVLSGREHLWERETFVIHFTTRGYDATTSDYVAAMSEAIERSLDIQFNDLGWSVPPADCGEGGDSRLDIYVLDLIDTPAIGIAVPESVVGDNPNTESIELFASYGFLVVDNDMDFLPEGTALDLMRTTVAHEVHHNIQFGYDFNDSYQGLYEAGATWIETLVYPTINNAYDYVEDVFQHPDLCIGRTRHRSDGREYGEWLMIDSFSRDLGMESYRFVWEHMASSQGLVGFYAALRELGTTPQEVIKRMAVRNLILDYALAKRFRSTVHIEAVINGTGFVSPRRSGVQPLGVDYLAVARRSRYTFGLVGDDALTMFVVGIDDHNKVATVYEIDRRGTVDTGLFDYAYLIVLNTAEHTTPTACDYEDWSIQVFDGTNNELATPDPDVWDSSQFIPVH